MLSTWQDVAVPVARAALSREQARHVALLADDVSQGDHRILSPLQLSDGSKDLRDLQLLHLRNLGIMSAPTRAEKSGYLRVVGTEVL